MNILKNKEAILPEKYPVMERKVPTISDAGYTKIGGFTLRKDIDICGQEGIQEQIIASDCNLIFATGGATLGKMQCINDLVLSSKGWVRIGDLKVGDSITGSDGKTQKVEAIFEQGVKDVYEIKTHDGGEMSLGLEHLCIVNERKPHKKSKTKILEFSDIKKALDGENNLKYSIPVMYAPVEYEPLKEGLPTSPSVFVNEIMKDSIPTNYKMSSIRERRTLLTAIMLKYGVTFQKAIVKTESLAKDIQELVRSLSGLCCIRKKKDNYVLKLKFDLDMNRRIIGYKYIGKQECRCIRVSNPDHLYVTRDFILTHNTFAGFIKALQGVGRPNYSARLVSGSLQDFKSESSLVRDMKVVYSDFSNCKFTVGDYPTAYWEEWNNTIKGMHMNFNTANPKEWYDCMEYLKSNQASYFYWDELTKVRDERVLLYSLSRNRDNSGLRPCTVCTFNPKKNHFSYNMLLDAGYIDTTYDPPIIRQGMSGVVKYFFVKGNYVKDIVWGNSREEVMSKCNIKLSKEDIAAGLTPEMMIKSFTCLTGEASQNRILLHATHGESVANLLNTGAKYAKSLKEGAFVDDDEEEESQTVTKRMIDGIFNNPEDNSDEYFMSLDVGGGGKGDPSFMWIWRGTSLIALDSYKGNPKELESWIKNLLNSYHIPMENFAFDACGLGHYLTAYTNGRSIKSNVRPIPEIDEAGNENTLDLCFNLRSQLLNKIQGMIVTGRLSCSVDRYTIINYYGKDRTLIDILYDEVNIFMKTTRNNKIYYKSKDEYKQKYGSSPNIIDALTYGAIFHINAKARKEVMPVYEESDYCDLYGCIGDEYDYDYD